MSVSRGRGRVSGEVATRYTSHAGTQQPITLLLTLISRGFIYDREKDLTQKILKDMTYIGAMGPPGGGRNNVDPRFVALFSVFNLPDPTNDVLKHMYSSIINERLRDFSPSVKDAAAKFPDAMLELFSYILESPPLCPVSFDAVDAILAPRRVRAASLVSAQTRPRPPSHG